MSKHTSLSSDLAQSYWPPSRALAIKLSLAYFSAGALWIAGSNWAMAYFRRHHDLPPAYDHVNSWFFVLMTAAALWFALDRYFKKSLRRQLELQEQFAQITVTVRQSEAKWRSYIENAPVGVLVTDEEGRQIEANRTAEELLGYERGESLDTTVLDLFLEPDWQTAMQRLVEAKSNGRVNAECNLRRKDGRPLLASIRASRIPGGRVLAVIQDITEGEKIRMEKEALARQRTLALDAAHMGWWHYDPESGMMNWDDRFRDIFDIVGLQGRHEEVLARLHPDDLPSVLDAVNRALEPIDPKAYSAEYRIRRLDGSLRWVQSSGLAEFDRKGETGRPVSFVGTVADVTARKQADEAVHESEERLRLALSAASQGLYDLDVQTGQAIVSPEYPSMLGYDPITFHETNAGWAERLHPADREKTEAALRDYLSGRRADYCVEFRQRTRSNDWKWILSIGKIVARDANGRPVRMVGTHTDISARKQAEEALRNREYQLWEVLNSNPNVILVKDRDSNILLANEALARIYRTPVEELIKTSQSALHASLGMPAEEVPQWLSDDRAVIDTGRKRMVEERTVWRDGSVHWYHTTKIRITLPDGKPGVLVVSEDTTERRQAEDALRLSEERLRLAGEAAHMGTWDRDVKTNRLYWSAEQERLLGYEPGTFPGTGEAFCELLHPDCLALHAEAQKRARTGDGILQAELHFVCRDGRERWGLIRGRTYFDEAGQPERIIGVDIDITDRKRSEAALRQSEAEFRTMFETASIGIAQADPHTGQLLRVNQKLCVTTRYSELELCSLRVSELVHPEDRQGDWKMFQRVVAGELREYHLERRYLRKDGSVAWVNVNMNVIRDPAGQPIRAMATVEDIGERKRTEDALRQSEERYRGLVETTFDWIWEVDAEGRYTYASPRVHDLLGYTPGEVLGKTPFDFMPETEAHRIRTAFHQLAAKSESFSALENTNRHKDGRLVVLETSGVPVLGPGGELLGYRGTDRDVTGRKRLEAELRQAQKLEAIGQLAGGVAHDFNNILAIIMMHVALLQMKPELDRETQDAVRDLEAAARRAATLTRQLLMFSRRSVLAIKPLDLNEVVANLLKMLTRLIGEHFDLRFDGKSYLPLVEADSGMLEQVLMNLVVNARDAMPRGGRITIKTTVAVLNDDQTKDHHDRYADSLFAWR